MCLFYYKGFVDNSNEDYLPATYLISFSSLLRQLVSEMTKTGSASEVLSNGTIDLNVSWKKKFKRKYTQSLANNYAFPLGNVERAN